MSQLVKLHAFLVAKQLDIKGIKNFLEIKVQADSSSELFYRLAEGKYQHYFNYGVIVFAGYTEEEMVWAIKAVQTFQRNPVTHWLRDSHEIRFEPGSEIQFEFNEVVVGSLDDKVMRITMFNLAQSVAMDYYHSVTENLLAEVKGFTQELETSGRLSLSRKAMRKFLGRALNTQNEIAENIYIFDAPELVWDDQFLDKLHLGLIRHFDLRVRFSELEYTMRIIEDNLTIFRELSHQRESSLLEWIIILLIFVEVLDMIISKLF
ncbi:MAG: RMD1 family protein [Cyclobacteriaceae bacterium]|nr:RMD1 family protein [Cyclobacteriaceae bacterium]UYN87502.1 MAG: RMD1 family protein [Cyclobacteriaceae bacterium]